MLFYKKNDSQQYGKMGGYFIVKNVSSTRTFTFKSRYSAIGSGSRQSVLIFGCANNTIVYGLLMIRNTGECVWDGTGTVSATMWSTGTVTVTLPNTTYDRLALLSPEPIA